MAEIPIERKDGRSVWPWIIALIIIAALIWWYVSSRNHNNAAAPARTDSAMTTTSPRAITGVTVASADVFVVRRNSYLGV